MSYYHPSSPNDNCHFLHLPLSFSSVFKLAIVEGFDYSQGHSAHSARCDDLIIFKHTRICIIILKARQTQHSFFFNVTLPSGRKHNQQNDAEDVIIRMLWKMKNQQSRILFGLIMYKRGKKNNEIFDVLPKLKRTTCETI